MSNLNFKFANTHTLRIIHSILPFDGIRSMRFFYEFGFLLLLLFLLLLFGFYRVLSLNDKNNRIGKVYGTRCTASSVNVNESTFDM